MRINEPYSQRSDSQNLRRVFLPCSTQHYRSIQARYCVGIRLAIVMHEQFIVVAPHDNGLAPNHLKVLVLNILEPEGSPVALTKIL